MLQSTCCSITAPLRVAQSPSQRTGSCVATLPISHFRLLRSSHSAFVRPFKAAETKSPRLCASNDGQRRRTAGVRAEISYIMVKPDGVQRGLVGEVITRFERKGFKLCGLKLFQCPKELAEEHYKDLKERPFYPALVDYIISGPVVAMCWEGPGVVKSARKLIGATNPLEAEPGTIRGDFGINTGRNIIHGSDSVENGERETGLWFDEDEVIQWSQTMEPWLLE